MHERAKRCPSRTLWATVFNTNSIVSQCEFWFYFGTSGKSFRMAKEIRPPQEVQPPLNLTRWARKPQKDHLNWSRLHRCDLKSSSFVGVFRLFPSPDDKDWWRAPVGLFMLHLWSQRHSRDLLFRFQMWSLSWFHMNIQQNIPIKCPWKTKAKMYLWTGWTDNSGKHHDVGLLAAVV